MSQSHYAILCSHVLIFRLVLGNHRILGTRSIFDVYSGWMNCHRVSSIVGRRIRALPTPPRFSGSRLSARTDFTPRNSSSKSFHEHRKFYQDRIVCTSAKRDAGKFSVLLTPPYDRMKERHTGFFSVHSAGSLSRGPDRSRIEEIFNLVALEHNRLERWNRFSLIASQKAATIWSIIELLRMICGIEVNTDDTDLGISP